jgi:hypothetical protein
MYVYGSRVKLRNEYSAITSYGLGSNSINADSETNAANDRLGLLTFSRL